MYSAPPPPKKIHLNLSSLFSPGSLLLLLLLLLLGNGLLQLIVKAAWRKGAPCWGGEFIHKAELMLRNSASQIFSPCQKENLGSKLKSCSCTDWGEVGRMAESREKKKLCLVKDKLFSWHFSPPLPLNFNQLLGGGREKKRFFGSVCNNKDECLQRWVCAARPLFS